MACTKIVTSAERAAELLRQGDIVDYQPGDGTRYELQTFWAVFSSAPGFVLACLNMHWSAVVPTEVSPQWWALYGIQGGWAALRPIFAAWGRTPSYLSETDLQLHRDARMEAEQRRYHYGVRRQQPSLLTHLVQVLDEGGGVSDAPS